MSFWGSPRQCMRPLKGEARQRLGSDPLKWLFEHSAQHWCGPDRRAYVFKGLVLFAMDGTTLRTHDNDETREHFGAQN